VKLPGWLIKPATLGALLAASLAANLFLGGIVAGHFGAARMRPPPLFAPGADTLFRLIPDRERRAMREHLHAHHPEVMETHLQMRKLHQDITRELGKDDPDRKLLEHKLAEVREGVELLEKSMHMAFLDTVLTLPVQERRGLLNEMRRQPPRGMSPPAGGPGRRDGLRPPASGADADDAPQGQPPGEDDEPPVD
jgi:uncharacterized membrane protein